MYASLLFSESRVFISKLSLYGESSVAPKELDEIVRIVDDDILRFPFAGALRRPLFSIVSTLSFTISLGRISTRILSIFLLILTILLFGRGGHCFELLRIQFKVAGDIFYEWAVAA